MSDYKAMRLAFRQEGHQWVAYLADPSTMEDTIWLGATLVSITQNPQCREAFMDYIKLAVTVLTTSITKTIIRWEEEQPAPEIERGGNA